MACEYGNSCTKTIPISNHEEAGDFLPHVCRSCRCKLLEGSRAGEGGNAVSWNGGEGGSRGIVEDNLGKAMYIIENLLLNFGDGKLK